MEQINLEDLKMEIIQAKLGMTNEKFAEFAEMSTNTLARKLKDPGSWKLNELNTIASKLDLSIGELLEKMKV